MGGQRKAGKRGGDKKGHVMHLKGIQVQNIPQAREVAIPIDQQHRGWIVKAQRSIFATRAALTSLFRMKDDHINAQNAQNCEIERPKDLPIRRN